MAFDPLVLHKHGAIFFEMNVKTCVNACRDKNQQHIMTPTPPLYLYKMICPLIKRV